MKIDFQRVTPDMIRDLEQGEIFVFGSNLSGIHGAGAANTALKFGAIWGQFNGLQGQSYAIPTKDKSVVKSLTIDQIKPFVDEFIEFAKNNKNLTFLVTEIGCGLAGHKHKDISILFRECIKIDNIHLPYKFWKILIDL
jgi:hypothetical protein